jgi:hypothetical protein
MLGIQFKASHDGNPIIISYIQSGPIVNKSLWIELLLPEKFNFGCSVSEKKNIV